RRWTTPEITSVATKWAGRAGGETAAAAGAAGGGAGRRLHDGAGFDACPQRDHGVGSAEARQRRAAGKTVIRKDSVGGGTSVPGSAIKGIRGQCRHRETERANETRIVGAATESFAGNPDGT